MDNRFGHPRDVIRTIPYRQVLRVRRIYESDEVCVERLKELSGDFIKRSFKRKFAGLQLLKPGIRNTEFRLTGSLKDNNL